MRPAVHVTVSLTLGALLGGATGSWRMAVMSAISGVLMDLDHVVEYILARKGWRSIRDFFTFWRTFREPKIYLVFHGAESALLLGLAAVLGWHPALTGGLAIGIAHHLILDQWGNGARWFCYFYTGRALNRFESRKLFYSLENL